MTEPGQPDRRVVLNDLLTLSRSLPDIRHDLSSFPWDSDDQLVALNRGHVIAVLERFLAGEFDAAVVEAWADAIEVRDDIGFEPQYGPVLADVVCWLANPLLTEPLTRDAAKRWRAQLLALDEAAAHQYAHDKELERRLAALLADLTDRIPADDAALAASFVDHNEFGIAMELLAAVLLDTAAPLRRSTVDEIAGLANAMGLSAELAT